MTRVSQLSDKVVRPSTNTSLCLFMTALLVVVWLSSAALAQSSSGAAQLDWFEMAMQLFGGLAIFLFGMEQMSEALKRLAGDRMRSVLGRLTGNRLIGVGTGAFVTAIIQSSSVTTVMLVGFVSTGLLSLSQAIGVVLGANIGTTITAQIVAFKVTHYSLIFISIGFLMSFAAKRDIIRSYGTLILGIGLIFFGMGLMSTGMKPLRSYEPFIALMGNVSYPLIGVLVAASFTALVQSSSATMGVVIALAMQGLISLEGGIALALGANVGTCVTAGLAAIGKSREAIRVAVAHIAFNLLGALLIIWFIPPFAEMIRQISPADPTLSGLEKLARETPRQIANAHTVFNVGVAIVFLPFSTLLARFCEWVVKDKALNGSPLLQPKFLDPQLLQTPQLALDRARLEIVRMCERVDAMLEDITPAALSGSLVQLEEIQDRDAEVDALHEHIITYLGEISRLSLSNTQMQHLMSLISITQGIEEIGDIIETGMVRLGTQRIEEGVVISPQTRKLIEDYHGQVLQAFRRMTQAVRGEDSAAHEAVLDMKASLARMADETVRHEVRRLIADEPQRLHTFRREIEIVDYLTDIFRHCRRIAKALDRDGKAPEQQESAPQDSQESGGDRKPKKENLSK